MEDSQQLPEPLTDDYILSRFNDLSIQIIHLKTQFDHLLQSFTIYTNLESKLEANTNVMKNIENSLNSHRVSIDGFSNDITEIKTKLIELQIEVFKNKPLESLT